MVNEAEKKLVLASGSPRRRELLENIACNFVVIPSEIEEDIGEALSPDEHVRCYQCS